MHHQVTRNNIFKENFERKSYCARAHLNDTNWDRPQACGSATIAAGVPHGRSTTNMYCYILGHLEGSCPGTTVGLLEGGVGAIANEGMCRGYYVHISISNLSLVFYTTLGIFFWCTVNYTPVYASNRIVVLTQPKCCFRERHFERLKRSTWCA